MGEFADDDDEPTSQPEDDDRMARILAQAGIQPVGRVAARPDRREFHLWPSCVPFWRFWASVQTQWRAGMSGYTGLDYAAVTARLERTFRTPRKRAEAWDHVAAMESAALAAWAEARGKSEGTVRR